MRNNLTGVLEQEHGDMLVEATPACASLYLFARQPKFLSLQSKRSNDIMGEILESNHYFITVKGLQ